ncbi:RecB family exonuclease [Streptomyces sp. NBC_01197]|uniref:RecB family exonuclease n=1 Tax=Streptomyces sp. NBC_01197 TaxID=2903768 RepID=UPI002E12691B|nr:PD-(D/E)XK nuclease family protein [Streptomyces sp. NBC_01197]
MSIEDQPRSVSQTEQYEKCAYRFYLQRVERVVPRPAAWSTQGTAFHSAAEAFEKSDRTATADEMVDLYSDFFSRKINGDLQKEPDLKRWLTAGPPAGEDIEARYRLGRQQVREYVAWSTETQPKIWKTPEGKPGLELYFKVEIGGVQVRGYIDQLPEEPDSSVRVRDLKTGSTKSKFQIKTYKVAVEKVYGVQVNRGDWYLGKTGKLSPVKGVDLSEVTEEEVGARYAAMDAGVKAGNFPANPGFDCRFCDVSHACSFSRSKS